MSKDKDSATQIRILSSVSPPCNPNRSCGSKIRFKKSICRA